MNAISNLPLVQKYLKANSHQKTQVSDSLGVVMKRGNVTLELHPRGLVLTDGWVTSWIILYGIGNKWAWDASHTTNKEFYRRLDKIAQQYTDIQEEG